MSRKKCQNFCHNLLHGVTRFFPPSPYLPFLLHPPLHSCLLPPVHQPAHLSTPVIIQPFTHPPTHSFTHPLNHPLTKPAAFPLLTPTYSPTHETHIFPPTLTSSSVRKHSRDITLFQLRGSGESLVLRCSRHLRLQIRGDYEDLLSCPQRHSSRAFCLPGTDGWMRGERDVCMYFIRDA